MGVHKHSGFSGFHPDDRPHGNAENTKRLHAREDAWYESIERMESSLFAEAYAAGKGGDKQVLKSYSDVRAAKDAAKLLGLRPNEIKLFVVPGETDAENRIAFQAVDSPDPPFTFMEIDPPKTVG